MSILGTRKRSQQEVRDEVLSRAGRYLVVHPERVESHDPSPLKVKEAWVYDRRYVVCLSEDEARKEAADREALVLALRELLRAGDKSLVGNKGYRRYLSDSGPGHFEIVEAKVGCSARRKTSTSTYGSCASPDGAYLLLTRSDVDLGPVENSRTSMMVVRMSDTAVVLGTSQDLEQRYPRASDGAKVGLSLGWGWEPHGTSAEIDHPHDPGTLIQHAARVPG